MAIVYSSVDGDVYNAVYALLKNNLTDLQSPTRTATDWIMSSFPDKANIDQSDFPIVTIDKAGVTESNKFTIKKTQFNISVVVNTFFAGDKAAKNCDTVADQVKQILTDNKYTSIRNSSKLYNMFFAGETPDEINYKGLKVHSKTLEVTGVFRFTG